MKTTSKSYFLVVALMAFTSLCLTSCDNEDKKRAEAASRVEQALGNRDFTAARAALQEYTTLAGTTYPYTEIAQEMAHKVNMAELNQMFGDGDILTASSLANELDCMDLFLELVTQNIGSIYRNNKTDELISLLASWRFSSSFNQKINKIWSGDYSKAIEHDTYGNDYRGLWDLCNVTYNDERTLYNNALDGLFNLALINEDVVLLRKVFKLYNPMAEVKSLKEIDESYSKIEFELKNSYRDAAALRAKEAGISL